MASSTTMKRVRTSLGLRAAKTRCTKRASPVYLKWSKRVVSVQSTEHTTE